MIKRIIPYLAYETTSEIHIFSLFHFKWQNLRKKGGVETWKHYFWARNTFRACLTCRKNGLMKVSHLLFENSNLVVVTCDVTRPFNSTRSFRRIGTHLSSRFRLIQGFGEEDVEEEKNHFEGKEKLCRQSR